MTMVNQGPTGQPRALIDLAEYAVQLDTHARALTGTDRDHALDDAARLLLRIAEALGTIDLMRRRSWQVVGDVTRYDALTYALDVLAEAALAVPDQRTWAANVARERYLDAMDAEDNA